jgi:uroporphyrinogen-III synthase
MTAILVTRPRGSAHPLVSALQDLGYRVYEIPTVEIEKAPTASQALGGYDWIVVTSPQGVEAIPEIPKGPRFAAVGQSTAAALRRRSVEPAHIAPESNAISLAETLPDVDGKRVALFRASIAEARMPDLLRQRGAIVDDITGYRTVEAPSQSAEPLRAALADPELAAVAFASGSAVRGFLALGGKASMPAVTIGPRTSEVARALGFTIVAESAEQTTEKFAATIAAAVPVEETHHA